MTPAARHSVGAGRSRGGPSRGYVGRSSAGTAPLVGMACAVARGVMQDIAAGFAFSARSYEPIGYHAPLLQACTLCRVASMKACGASPSTTSTRCLESVSWNSLAPGESCVVRTPGAVQTPPVDSAASTDARREVDKRHHWRDPLSVGGHTRTRYVSETLVEVTFRAIKQ